MKTGLKIHMHVVLLVLSLFSFANQTHAQDEISQYTLSTQEQAWVDSFISQAINWAKQEEKDLLSQGRPLTEKESDIAKKMGVENPKVVRVVFKEKLMRIPDAEPLRSILLEMGFDSPEFWGMALGRAIIIKPKFKDSESLLSHELVHVAQVERLGFENFIQRYFIEMRRFGYQDAPLEKEAYAKQLQ